MEEHRPIVDEPHERRALEDEARDSRLEADAAWAEVNRLREALGRIAYGEAGQGDLIARATLGVDNINRPRIRKWAHCTLCGYRELERLKPEQQACDHEWEVVVQSLGED